MLVATREHLGMEDSTENKLAEIICQMKCPKDFVCYKSGFKTLCKAEDVGMQSYLRCLEKNPSDCIFALG